jgi:hypothetical protein
LGILIIGEGWLGDDDQCIARRLGIDFLCSEQALFCHWITWERKRYWLICEGLFLGLFGKVDKSLRIDLYDF